jgi:hypothetical protein
MFLTLTGSSALHYSLTYIPRIDTCARSVIYHLCFFSLPIRCHCASYNFLKNKDLSFSCTEHSMLAVTDLNISVHVAIAQGHNIASSFLEIG